MIQAHHFHGWQVAVLLLAFMPVSLRAQGNTNLAKWEPEIKAFERSDRTNMPPRGAVLFVGSSSIRFWTTLSNDFAGIPVINRGFGGSEIADSTGLADRIIFPYAPRMIVFYAGDNDLANGKSADQVVADYGEFVKKIRSHLPGVPIAYISIKPSVLRWKLKDKIVEANRRIAAMKDDHLIYIDIFTPMLDAAGNPRADLLKADGLHPNAAAYHLWTDIIKPLLK